MKTLASLYGKKSIFIFSIRVPEEVSIMRNSHRSICSVCKTPAGFLGGKKSNVCMFCGASLRKRTLDTPDVIRVRIQEYKNRTFPILEELRNGKYQIMKINGEPAPYRMFEEIQKRLR